MGGEGGGVGLMLALIFFFFMLSVNGMSEKLPWDQEL